MKPVKTMQRYKCDFCSKRSVKSVIAIHEKRCFRNPNRYCDFCDNKRYTMESGFKIPCPYCVMFDPKRLKEIEEREKKEAERR